MKNLLIKSDDYGLGLFIETEGAVEPWRYYKAGDDVVYLLICVVQEQFDGIRYLGTMEDEEREEHFC